MAKKFKQFIYYNQDNINNSPLEISYNTLCTGNIFNKFMPACHIGIQALPGTKFYLNGSYLPIVIGYTGIYELELDNTSQITSIRFDDESINRIAKNDETFLIVDLIYEEDE